MPCSNTPVVPDKLFRLDRWVDAKPMGYKVKLQFWVYGDDALVILSTNASMKNHTFTEDEGSTSYEIGI